MTIPLIFTFHLFIQRSRASQPPVFVAAHFRDSIKGVINGIGNSIFPNYKLRLNVSRIK